MSFRLSTIFYVFAVVGASLATFGSGGVFVAVFVLALWARAFYASTRPWAVGVLALLLAGSAFGAFVTFVLHTIPSARSSERQSACMGNLKQLALALIAYDDAHGAFPPAYVADADGNPMHSWRVLILPYLDEQALYNKYDFNELWNGPNNSKLAAQMPDVFACPALQAQSGQSATATNYFAIVDPNTAWPVDKKIRWEDLGHADGMSRTILLIEASGLDVNWMEPRDVTLDEAIELLTTTNLRSGHMYHLDDFLTMSYYQTLGRNVAYCDGHVEWMGQLSDPDIAKALLTVAGGESLPSELDESYVDGVTTTVVKWDKVWALSVFVVLAVLPAAWLRRKRVDIEQE